MAKKNTKKATTKKEVAVEETPVLETVVTTEPKEEVVEEEIVSGDGLLSEDLVVEKEDHLFTMDVSMYGIKKEETEKLINTAIKFYFENKDKVLVEPSSDVEETKEQSDLLGLIAEYEKTLKLFNYVPKSKVITFLKTLKENL